MKEIYCKTGKMNVELPEEAWVEFGPWVPITPCEGCAHEYHTKRVEYLHRQIKDAELIKLKTVEEYKHAVSVIKTFLTGKAEEVVMCRCDCTVHYPDYSSKKG